MESRNKEEQEFINAKINALKLAADWLPGIKSSKISDPTKISISANEDKSILA